MRLAPACAAIACLAAVLPSCKTKQPADPPPAKTLVTSFDFDDVPVPRDFEHVREKSHVVQNVNFRSGTLVYVGRAQMSVLRDWYRKSMTSAACGWKPVPGPSGETGVGPYTLRFEKGVERCDVHIESPDDTTIVTVTLGLK